MTAQTARLITEFRHPHVSGALATVRTSRLGPGSWITEILGGGGLDGIHYNNQNETAAAHEHERVVDIVQINLPGGKPVEILGKGGGGWVGIQAQLKPKPQNQRDTSSE